uniref:RacGAP n=1 Tax=Platynereis dumerilii TaxID=6359 RepID=A0A2H5BF96_PLADU|nr:RacGAP [Platynereis dumerilii]
MGDYQLTLVAEYDDIVRNNAILTAGIETEFLRFLQSQETCRKRWLESEDGAKEMRNRLKNLENENATLTTRLRHARSTIDNEIKKRMKAEQDKESLERQIAIVRELLTEKNNQTMLNQRDRERLAFLSSTCLPSVPANSPKKSMSNIDKSASNLSDCDISFDVTGEDLDETRTRSGRRHKKRPSAPPMEEDDLDTTPPGKKAKRDAPEKPKRSKHRRSKSAVIATATLSVQDNGEIEADTHIKTPDRPRRSGRMRKIHSAKDVKEIAKENGGDSDDSTMRSPGGVFTPDRSPLRQMSSIGKGLNRAHDFETKTIIWPETCIPCGKKVRFGKEVLKCRDCFTTAHVGCRDDVPLPCVRASVPNSSSRSAAATLSDFIATSEPPMIPALVIHCVNEVEKRGLDEAGLYRLVGSKTEIRALKDKFLRGRGTPNLAHINDVNVITGCLKDFLMHLKEPIITFALWKDFANAAEMPCEEDSVSSTYQAISQLPQANRDTLAFLILHLQRVAQSPDCKMPQQSLCKVLGPTLVGHSIADPSPMQLQAEMVKHYKVMDRLMSLSGDYWDNFICAGDNLTSMGQNIISTPQTIISTPQTPESMKDPGLHSMLYPQDSTERKNSTPRFGLHRGRQMPQRNPKTFFPPPNHY